MKEARKLLSDLGLNHVKILAKVRARMHALSTALTSQALAAAFARE